MEFLVYQLSIQSPTSQILEVGFEVGIFGAGDLKSNVLKRIVHIWKTNIRLVPHADLIDFLETYFKIVLRGFLGYSYFYYINFDVHIDLK